MLNPRLVFLALKGYLAGPYEHRPALDEVVQFQTGLAFMTGPPGQPLRAGASVIDILGAVFGVVAAQAALQERAITGKGQRVSARRCERCNVSWAPVGQPGDLFTDPHLLATGGLLDVFISRFGGRDGKIAGLPAATGVRYRPTPSRLAAAAAAHGRAQRRGAGRGRFHYR